MRPPFPAALVVARRAMVVAAAAMVIAALAVVVALLGEPGSDPAETAALERARDDAAAAQEEADAATAMADAAIIIAEEAGAKAAAAEVALADAVASAGVTVDPEVIARLEAQLEQARNLAATALVAADAAAAPDAETAPADEAALEDETPADDAATDQGPEAEEEPEAEDSPPQGDPALEEPMSEPDDTDADAAAALPGEPFEFGPSAGAALFVVGLPYDDVLNVRHLPAGEVVATLDPMDRAGGRAPFLIVRDAAGVSIDELDLGSALTATGLSRQLRTTVWHQLQAAGVTGWSSAAYLAQFGSAEDVTSEVLAALGDNITADTMSDLGLRVAHTMASQEPASRVVVTSGAGGHENVFTIGVDVIGLADDSLLGYRFHISADPAGNWIQDADPGPYTLNHVSRTAMCHRGVSANGVCN